MITRINFYEFILHMIFKFFRENSHYWNGQFQEIRKNHIWGEFVKIQVVMIYVIFHQK